MLENKKNSLWNYLFLGSCGLILGGVYYLYKKITSNNYLNNEDIQKIRELNEESEGKLTTEIAIKLLAFINKKTDDYINTKYSNLEKERRNAYNNDELYSKICEKMLDIRNNTYLQVSDKVLNEFGVSNENLGEYLQGISPIELEKKMFAEEKPEFEFNKPPDRTKVKQAFLHYAKASIQHMDNFTKINKNQLSNSEQELVLFDLMIMKYKIDDDLYRSFNITEQQLRYLLFEYNLNEDPVVKEKIDQMSEYEDNMSE